MPVAYVTGLSYRASRQALPVSADVLRFERDLGIVGDCHASAISPRQVLLVSMDAYRTFALGPHSLRENVLIGSAELGLESGITLRLGDSAVLAVSFPCEPCAKLERVRPGLMRAIGGARGWLARVLQSGFVRVGDQIAQLPGTSTRHSAIWQERLFATVGQIPAGQVVTYSRLADAIGVPRAYARVFPRILRAQDGLPWHRAVPSGPRPVAPEHRRRLAAEGLAPGAFLAAEFN